MAKRIVAVFTGNRAEYGLQFPILKAIDAHKDLDYRLIVSGAHLDPNFGQTRLEIENDGFTIHDEVEIKLENDSNISTAMAIGSGIQSLTRVLAKVMPDIFVVYADRFEGFAAVIAGTQMNIPTAHIEGGDITQGGALDDSVRHAMTKLAHIHFTTNQQATNRILTMGEEDWRVFTVGFPAIDLISDKNFATPNELSTKYGLDVNRPIILFTQHSVTTEFNKAGDQIKPSLLAVQHFADQSVQAILTYPNNDAGGRIIIEELNKLDRQSLINIQIHKSLGRYYYQGILALAKSKTSRVVCIGNSSSGIKETPAFGCPTVNVGSRQEGRLRGENVIDTPYDTKLIINAVNRCLFDKQFKEICSNCKNPYGKGDASSQIAETLAKIPLDPKILRKGMTIKGEVFP